MSCTPLQTNVGKGNADARSRRLLATGFIADDISEGSVFPSAGGNSASASVQAVYWRCIACFFYAARLNNPDLRLALFTNVSPPPIDGVDLSALLHRLDVEVIRLPLLHRLPSARAISWGNVFYVLDILDHLRKYDSESALILLDNDVLCTGPLDRLFERLAAVGNVGYVLSTAPDEDINGLSRRQMAAISGTLPQHFGGELFGIDLGLEQSVPDQARDLWREATADDGAATMINTEEQFWSILYARHGTNVAMTDDLLKRIWTDPRHSTVTAGDETLMLWHLPSEKRHGLHDLFVWGAARDFCSVSNAEFRRLAGTLCGVPRKGLRKLMRDGVRQIASKLKVRA